MSIFIDPGLAIGFSGVVIALVQVWRGHRKEISDNTFKVFDSLQGDKAREYRFGVRKILDVAAAHSNTFDDISIDDRARLASVAWTFCFAGLLARKKRVDLQLMLEAWSHTITYNHKCLQPYRTWLEQRYGTGEAVFWMHFDWLALKAEEYIKLKQRSSFPKHRSD